MFEQVFIFIFGAVIGSFLNVCIHRFPREESIVSPGSHCPHCKQPVAWKDNIPVISYLMLRGKCRGCAKPISIRYWAVEILNAVIWVMLWRFYGWSPFFFAGIILFSILLAITFTDFETGYIPDKFTLPGMAAGLILSSVWPQLHGETVWFQGLLHSFLGLLVGGGVLLLIGMIGNFIFKKESMGGGDVKLLAMLGAFVGIKEALLIFLLSPIVALPIALYLRLFKKAETLPYGPYIALTGAVFYLYGEWIIANFFSYY